MGITKRWRLPGGLAMNEHQLAHWRRLEDKKAREAKRAQDKLKKRTKK
jgi:hypothetical protein